MSSKFELICEVFFVIWIIAVAIVVILAPFVTLGMLASYLWGLV